MIPILYQSPDFILYSYPFLMGIGWGLGIQLFISLIEEKKLTKIKFLILGIFISSWIGAKLLFYLTVGDKFGNYINQISFWTGGGFVFYGGLLGGFVYLIIFHQFIRKITISEINALVPALALGHAIGRLGCFLAGCCYGKETTYWAGIHFHGVSRLPTQLFEAFVLFLIAYFFWKKSNSNREHVTAYLFTYGVVRFLIEIFRDDPIRGLWGVFTPSQWISLSLIVMAISIRKFTKNHYFQA